MLAAAQTRRISSPNNAKVFRADHDRRCRLRRLRHFRRRHPDTRARSYRASRAALHPVSFHRAVLADARSAIGTMSGVGASLSRYFLAHSTSTIISTSTAALPGSAAILTAERACLPIASPKTSTIKSEKTFTTRGWPCQCGFDRGGVEADPVGRAARAPQRGWCGSGVLIRSASMSTMFSSLERSAAEIFEMARWPPDTATLTAARHNTD
jgi:hypothetical protein